METRSIQDAVNDGDVETVRALLDAGADVRCEESTSYSLLISAMYGRNIARDPNLVSLVKLLIERKVPLDNVTEYCESALSVASNHGRFDVVRVLLDAGADPAPLKWTPLMHAVAFATVEAVQSMIDSGADLSARDFWSRTPWLLSLQVGDVSKARALLSAGANGLDRGRCGKTPMEYPIINGHANMLRWLIDAGFFVDAVNDFQQTALMEAAEMGATESVRILLDAGADVHLTGRSDQKAINVATNLEIVRLLVAHGADLSEMSREMRAVLTKVSLDAPVAASREEYLAAKHREFGKSNPEKMNHPFWKAMISSGADAYAAAKQFGDDEYPRRAIWCFRRFGKSLNELPDGRIIEIAGEHEDYYDPDFCIYNDVIVHHGNGTFDIYGYPKEIFPPTDFHSATPVGEFIYIIGSLGYMGERRFGETPVYRLDVRTFSITAVETWGDNPGWISHHKAIYTKDGTIRISLGKISALDGTKETYEDNRSRFVLDLKTRTWRREG